MCRESLESSAEVPAARRVEVPSAVARLSRALGAAIAALIFPNVAAAQTYTAIEINGPPGYERTAPSDINNRLEVVGIMRGAAGTLPFVWDPVGGLRALPSLSTSDNPGEGTLFIDDGSNIYAVRVDGVTRRAVKLVELTWRDLPVPAYDDLWLKLTDNGIALVGSRRASQSWAVVGDNVYDLVALTGGAYVSAVNEEGMLGGCRHGQAYLRTPDGGEQHWGARDESLCVSAIGQTRYVIAHGASLLYYGSPDGRTFTSQSSASPGASRMMLDVNASGMAVGISTVAVMLKTQFGFLYRGGVSLSLADAVVNRANRHWIPAALNDAGYVAVYAAPVAQTVWWASSTQGAVLVPSRAMAPVDLVFNVIADSVQLRWQSVFGAFDYILEAGSTPGAADLYSGSLGDVSSFSARVAPGRYYVRLRARNAVGVSDPSAELVIDVGVPLRAPLAPAGLTWSIQFNPSIVRLAWQPVNNVSDYIVEVGSAPGASDLFNTSVGGVYAVSAPVPAGRYYVRVRARNSAGVSPPSDEVVIGVP